MRRIVIAAVGTPILVALLLASVLAWSHTAPAHAGDSAGAGTEAEAISAGAYHTCALKDGAVSCWGWNRYGQLGNNSTTDSNVPAAVAGLTSAVTAISSGDSHTCALKDGGAWCWGSTGQGRLGSATAPVDCLGSPCSKAPVTVSGMASGVTAISAGGAHTCALKDGAAWCWGDNGHGQLGNNSTTASGAPVAVSGLTSGVTAVSAGLNHSCALKDGGVWCWGDNFNGELGNNTTADSLLPVAVPALASGVSALSAGWNDTCAVKDGAVWCWGYNGYGQLGNNSTTDSHVPAAVSGLTGGVSAIGAGYLHTCALKDGAVSCWGYNFNGQLGNATATDSPVPVAVSGLVSGVTAMSGGGYHTCARKAGGVSCWGGNGQGQLGNSSTTDSHVPATVSGMAGGTGATAAISAGMNHTCAVKDGGAWCWGYNVYGQLGNNGTTNSLTPVMVSGLGTGVSAISAGEDYTCALKNGGVSCWGINAHGQLGNNSTTNSSVPVSVTGLAGAVTAISAKGRHTCALRQGGVWCWGLNASGQLGNGTTTSSSVPVAVSGLPSGVTAISAGGGFGGLPSGEHTCALKDGGVWCWGKNDVGQLGNVGGSSAVPVAVSGLSSGVTALSAGADHTCALKDGGVWCWGWNPFGQLGNNSTSDQYVPVPVPVLSSGVSASGAGYFHTCATRDGAGWCWGLNGAGQLGSTTSGTCQAEADPCSTVPLAVSGLVNGVTEISAGYSHTCALKDRAVWCWGGNGFGQLGNNSTAGSVVPVAVVWAPPPTPTPTITPTPTLTPTPTITPTATLTPYVVTATVVPSAGGIVTAPSGIGTAVVSVSFPPGALGSGSLPVAVNVHIIDPSTQPVPPAGVTALVALDLSTNPSMPSFASPVTITIPYDPAACDATCEANMGIQVYTGGAWQFLAGVVDTVNHTVSVDVTHFTPYQLIVTTASVGGIAEQPDMTRLPAAAASGGADTAYILGAAIAVIVAAAWCGRLAQAAHVTADKVRRTDGTDLR